MHLANNTEVHTRGLGNNCQCIGTLDGKLTVCLRQINHFTGKASREIFQVIEVCFNIRGIDA